MTESRAVLNLVSRARGRLWFAEALRLIRLGLLGSAIIGVPIALAGPAARAARGGQAGPALAVLASLPLLAALLVSAMRRPTAFEAARRLDRRLGAETLLLTAWDLGRSHRMGGAGALVLERAGRLADQWDARFCAEGGTRHLAPLVPAFLMWAAATVWLLLAGLSSGLGDAPEPLSPGLPGATETPMDQERPTDPPTLESLVADLRRTAEPASMDASGPPPNSPDLTHEAPSGAMIAIAAGPGPEPTLAASPSSGPGEAVPGTSEAHKSGRSVPRGPGGGTASGPGAAGIGTHAAPEAVVVPPSRAPAETRPMTGSSLALARDGVSTAEPGGGAIPLAPQEPSPERAPKVEARPSAATPIARARLARPLAPAQRALIDRYWARLRGVDAP